MVSDIPRREFLARITSLLGIAWAAVIAIPGVGFLLTPVMRRAPSKELWLEFKLPPSLAPDTPIRFDFHTEVEDGWMTRKSTGFVYAVKHGDQVVAYSPTCTHLGCRVSWSPADQRFKCPCHGGVYALDASVVAGPPPRPLAKLPVEIAADSFRVEVSQVV